MSKDFKCPACGAVMKFGGGDSMFQTCPTCNAPIVVPQEVYYTEKQQIASEDFASLTHDKPVVSEPISLDMGAGEVAQDEKIEQIVSQTGNANPLDPPSDETESPLDLPRTKNEKRKEEIRQPTEPELAQLDYLINQERKIDAIKFCRQIYKCDLVTAKEMIDEIFEQREIA